MSYNDNITAHCSPYRIDGPAIISFSGGRSSGMMLYNIVQEHRGTLPSDVHVVFSNTGKECQETLDFVQRCADEFGVRIRWVQYRWAEMPADRWEEVSHNSAARHGEPFREMVEKETGALPNPVMRICTARMKVLAIHRWANVEGIGDYTSVIGYRADEQRRVSNARAREEKDRSSGVSFVFPLYTDGVTKRHVSAFWSRMPFDLRLPNVRGSTPHGNCDLCFLKGTKTLLSLIREKPERADWWIQMESMPLASKPNGALFRVDRPSYANLKKIALSQVDFSDIADDFDTRPCGCHD